MTHHDHAVAVALALTVVGYSLAYEVLKHWGSVVLNLYKEHEWKPANWLTLASTLGIVFMCLDAGYWAFPWTADYYDLSWAPALFKAGVYFNIPFRHTALIFFCLLHLSAYYLYLKDRQESLRKFYLVVVRSILLGLLTWVFLLLTK